MSEFSGLSKPALRALANAGVATPAELAERRAADVSKLHGMGPNGVARLRALLAAQGRRFSDE